MIKSEWSVVYIVGTRRLYKKVFLPLNVDFVLVNHADPDEMLQNILSGSSWFARVPI